MFLTIESARLPCWTTLSRLPLQHVGKLVDLAARLSSSASRFSVSCSSSISSVETAEKLLTKLSGFLISCAMPAVNWPSEASFSVWTRRSCAVRRSSSDSASSRVRASTLVEQAHVLDRDRGLVGKGRDQLDLLVGERPDFRRVKTSTPIASPSRSIGTARTVRKSPVSAPRAMCSPGRPRRREYGPSALQAARGRTRSRAPAAIGMSLTCSINSCEKP